MPLTWLSLAHFAPFFSALSSASLASFASQGGVKKSFRCPHGVQTAPRGFGEAKEGERAAESIAVSFLFFAALSLSVCSSTSVVPRAE